MNIRILSEIIKNLGSVFEKKDGPFFKRINLVRLNAYIGLIIIFLCIVLLALDTIVFFIDLFF